MNAAKLKKILHSKRWTRFMENTSQSLQINLSLLIFDQQLYQVPPTCPLCLKPYVPLREGDISKALQVRDQFITEEGQLAIILTIGPALTVVARECTPCSGKNILPLKERSQLAQKLLTSFYITLYESIDGFFQRIVPFLNAVDSGICLVNEDNIIRYVNRPFEALFEVSKQELLGKQSDFIKGPWTPYLKREIEQPIEGKVELLNINDKEAFVDWQISPFLKNDTLQGWIICVKDCTDYYRWQEEIIKAEYLATANTLVGSLAHELRNPLSAAKGILQLTRQRGNSNASRRYLELIEKEIDRVTALLNEFLFLGNPADKIDKPVPLAPLLRELTPLLELEAHKYGASLIVDIQSDPYVTMDLNQLTRLFLNLVRNGAQAAGQQGLISIYLQTKNNQVIITIKDTGPGISYHHKDKVFRPFFSTKEGGTGLGLAVVQTIIYKQGGTIEVKNARGGGAVFQISLPSRRKADNFPLDVLLIVEDYLLRYPTQQAIQGAKLSVITADSLQGGVNLLTDYPVKSIVIENNLLREYADVTYLKEQLSTNKIVILGEFPSYSLFPEAIYLKTPLNYLHLISQLKLLCSN